MKTTSERILGFIAVIFLVFGITYLNFDDLSHADNIRPYIMLVLGIVLLGYWFKIRSRQK
jgi:uncharacterized membrane protein